MTLTSRKLLAVLLLAIIVVTMTAFVMLFNVAESNEAYAASSSTLWYEVYNFQDYLDYLEAVKFANAYIAYLEDDNQAPATDTTYRNPDWDNTGSDSRYHIKVNGQSAYSYFGGYPANLTKYSSIISTLNADWVEGRRGYALSTYTSGEQVVPMYTQKTTFSANQYMMIKVYMQSDTGIRGAKIFLDVAGTLNLTNAHNISQTILPTDNDDYIYYWTDGKYEGSDYTGIFNEGAFPSPNSSMPCIYGACNPKNTDTIMAGYIAFKVKSGASSGDIGCFNKNTTSTITVQPAEVSTITETPKSITVEGGTDAKAELPSTNVKVNSAGVTAGTNTNVTIDSESKSLPVYKGPTQAASTSSAYLEIKPSYGSVNNVSYYIGTSCPTTQGGFNLGTFPTPGTSLTITPSSWPAGTTLYALAEIVSDDTHTTNYFVITAPKDAELANLAISGGSGSSVCALTTSFSSSTTTYTVNISQNTTSMSITATLNNNGANGETLTIDGGSASHNVAKTISGLTTAKTSIAIVVTAANGEDETYTLNLNWISSDVELSALSVKVDNTTTTNKSAMTYTGSPSYKYTVSGSSKVPFGSSYFTVTATNSTGTIKYSLDGSTYTTIASGTEFPSGGVSFGSGTGEVTKTVKIKVTAADGVTNREYTLEVTRYGGNTDSSLSSSSYKIRTGSSYSGDTAITSYDSNNKATISGIAYKKSAVAVKVTPTASAINKIEYTYTVDGVAGTPGVVSTSTYTNDFTFSTTSTAACTIVVEITVYAQDPAHYTTYTITFNRVAASTNNSYSAFTLYNNVTTQISGSWSGTTFTAGTIDYTVTGVKINVTFDALATATAADNASPSTSYNLTSGTTSGLFSYSSTAEEKKEITLTITSEAGVPATYTIKVTRNAADNDASYTIVVKNGANTSTYTLKTPVPSTGFDTSTNEQVQEISTKVPYTETQMIVTIAPTKGTTKVYYGGTLVTGAKTLPIDQSVYIEYDASESFTLTTQAGNSFNVTLKYTREAGVTDASLASNPDVVGVHSGTHYGADASSTSTTFNYEYVRSAENNATTYYLGITPSKPATSKIYATTSIPTSASDSILNTSSLYSGSMGSKSFTVGTILYITIVPQVASQYKVYTINVTAKDERETEAGINNITITGLASGTTFTFVATTLSYGVYTVPYSTTSITYEVTMKSEKESLAKCGLNGTGTSGAVGATKKYNGSMNLISGTTNNLVIQAQAENTSIKGSTYTIQIARSIGSTANLLTSLAINSNNVTIPSTSTAIDYCVVRTVTSAQIDFTISANAKCELTNVDSGVTLADTLTYTRSLAVAPSVNTVTIKVVSEQDYVDYGSSAPSKVYTIKIYVAEQFYNVSNIALYSNSAATTSLVTDQTYSFTPSTTSYTLTGSYSNMPGVIAVVQKGTDSPNAVVSGDITYTNLTAGTPKTLTITIKSEYASLNPSITNQSETYTYTLTRDSASTDNTLSDLWVIADGTRVNITAPTVFVPTTNGTYLVGNLTGSSIQLGYTLSDPTHAKVDSTSNLNATLSATNTTEQLTVKVLNELGVPNTYTVKVSSTNLVLNTNNTINSINVNSDGSTNLITYSPSQATYIAAPDQNYGVASINVSAVLASTTATLKINGNAAASGEIVTIPLNRNAASGDTTVITVQATAEDPTKVGTEYKITVRSLPADTDKTLKVFTIDGNAASNGDVIKVVNTKTAVSFNAETNSAKSTISPHDTGIFTKYSSSAKSLNVGSNTISFTVTAEDLSTQVYTVTIIRDDINQLSNLEVYNPGYLSGANLITFSDGSPYNVNVPYDVTSVEVDYTLDPTATAANLTVTGAGTKSLTPGVKTTITVKVVAASGATETYQVYVTRAAGNTDNFITKYISEDGRDIAFTGNTITYVLDRTYTVGGTFHPTYTVSDNATHAIKETATALYLGLNQFTIEVTSQTGAVNTYIIKVYVCDTDNTIANIELLNASTMATYVDTNNDSLTYGDTTFVYGPFAAAYSTNNIYLKITPTKSTSVIYVNNAQFTNSVVSLTGGTNTFKIYVKSEYGTFNTSATGVDSSEYTITINRDTPNSDARLKSLSAKIGGAEQIALFNPETDTYSITNIGDIAGVGNNETTIVISAEAMVAYPKTTVENGTSRSSSTNTGAVTYNKTLTGTTTDTTTGVTTGYNFEHVITVTAEDGTVKTYTLYISRGPLSLNDDNTIVSIEVKDSEGRTHLASTQFNASTTVYNITIPYGPQSYSITANGYAGSPITITGAEQFQINFASPYVNAAGNYYRSHIVYATSQGGTKGTEYTINVTVAKPSSDATLSDLQVNWDTLSGFSPNTTSYTIAAVPNTVDSIYISATATDPTATITGHIGTVNLVEGNNTYVVTVTAQSGASKNYYINIKRQYSSPELSDLEVIGEQLLNTQDKAVVFNPATLTYHVIVKYVTDSITIDAIVDESTYTVSCSNSTVISSTGSVREFKANLNVGVNEFTVNVKSTHGMSTSYKLIVQRRDKDSANTNIASLKITSIEIDGDGNKHLSEVLMPEGEYNSLQSTYEYTVPNKVRSLDLAYTAEKVADAYGPGAKITVFNNENLDVGKNQVLILVTAEDGETTRAVIVNVTREPNAFDVSVSGENNTILEGEKSLSTFRSDFANSTVKSVYEVSTAVTSLDFTVLNRDTSDTSKPTFQVINGSNLKVGDNEVKLLITATDGTVTEQKIVVKRLPMSFSVNKKAYDYSCDEVQGTTSNNYVINLGSKTVDAIEDYTKYIEYDQSQQLKTEVISKSNSEVVVKVATSDSAEVEYVHFLIDTTANNGTVFDIIFWIILGIAIILLIIILIFVNKDKYGSVSNSRKK